MSFLFDKFIAILPEIFITVLSLSFILYFLFKFPKTFLSDSISKELFLKNNTYVGIIIVIALLYIILKLIYFNVYNPNETFIFIPNLSVSIDNYSSNLYSIGLDSLHNYLQFVNVYLTTDLTSFLFLNFNNCTLFVKLLIY